MTQKFHMGKNGPGICKAQEGRCPMKDEDGNPVPHGSKEVMQEAFEEKLKNEHGELLTLSKDIPGFPNLATMQTIIAPDDDGIYTVETGEYIGFCVENVNLNDVDVLSDVLEAHAGSNFSAGEIDGKKFYVETEDWSGVQNVLMKVELFDEMADRGLEFDEHADPKLINLLEEVKISETHHDAEDEATYMEPKVAGTNSILELNGTYDKVHENKSYFNDSKLDELKRIASLPDRPLSSAFVESTVLKFKNNPSGVETNKIQNGAALVANAHMAINPISSKDSLIKVTYNSADMPLVELADELPDRSTLRINAARGPSTPMTVQSAQVKLVNGAEISHIGGGYLFKEKRAKEADFYDATNEEHVKKYGEYVKRIESVSKKLLNLSDETGIAHKKASEINDNAKGLIEKLNL